MTFLYKYILFDLDGTLTDSAPGIINCIKYACGKMGISCPSDGALSAFVGPPLLAMMQKTFSLSDSDSEKMLALYRERFSKVGLFENSVYPGVREMLASVKKAGKKLALATSKPEVYAVRILEKFSLIEYFDAVTGSELSGAHVEKRDVMAMSMKKLSAERAETLMVGDRKYDLEAANALGVDALFVSYGYAAPGEELPFSPKFTAASAEGVEKIILFE